MTAVTTVGLAQSIRRDSPAVGLACSESTGIEQNELAGSWNATKAEFASVADPTVKVDIVALGGSMTFTIDAAGNLNMAVSDGQGRVGTDSGTIVVDGSSVTVNIDGTPATGTISRNGDTVTINLTTGAEFDFDDDGVDDPATLLIEMQLA